MILYIAIVYVLIGAFFGARYLASRLSGTHAPAGTFIGYLVFWPVILLRRLLGHGHGGSG